MTAPDSIQLAQAVLPDMADDVPRAVIVGAGLLTPFGDLSATWRAMCEGRYLTTHTRIPLETSTNDPSPRAMTLAIHAARHAVAGIDLRRLQDSRTALVVGTSKGTIESWLAPPLIYMASRPYIAGGLQPTGLADIAEAVAIEFAMTGPRLTVSAACASGLVALIRATLMIRSGEAQRVLIVSAESSLHPLFLASYQRLGVLSPDGSGCRPFDRSRAGFFVSEAAAAILLEASNPESPGGGVNVDNFALGADATHITGLDENATTLRTLLRRAIAGRPVDLIHAHATGTPLNDSVELAAIDDAMANQPNPPAVYSHKAAIGHTLGPSGLISVALNSLAHAKSIVPPNMRTHDPLTTRHVTISQAIGQRPIQRSLVIAAGFGGPVAVVSLSTNCHPADTPIP